MTLWTDFLGSEIRLVDVGGVQTRVMTAGGGEAVFVLLHGRGGHLESWRANVRPLAERARVVAFDLLGHGRTGRRDCDYGIVDLTEHAAQTLDVLGLASAILVGQSIGGWVGARLALLRPELVRALVLIEPAGLQAEEERLADPAVSAAYLRGGRAFEEPTTDAVRDRLVGLVSDPNLVDEELVETRRMLYAPGEARDVHRRVRAADNSAVLLTPKTLSRIKAPVLIVHGEHAHLPLDVAVRAANAAQARLVTVGAAKQWPQLERPDVVNPLLVELTSNGGNP